MSIPRLVSASTPISGKRPFFAPAAELETWLSGHDTRVEWTNPERFRTENGHQPSRLVGQPGDLLGNSDLMGKAHLNHLNL